MTKTWIEDLMSSTRAHRAFTGEVEFTGASEDDRTGRTVQFRLVRKPDELLTAHPFSTFTRRRRGHAGTRFEAVFSAIADEPWTVSCEVMLLNWADGPAGATVKFLLDFALDDHPFLKCVRRTKDSAGSGFMLVLMEIDDDQTIVNQEQRDRVERRSKQKLSNVAAMIVKHPRFHEWLREVRFGPSETIDGPINTKIADTWLKDTISIDSKADLDNDENVKQIAAFLKLKAAFVEWQELQGYDLEE
jgi:hypothetical protein